MATRWAASFFPQNYNMFTRKHKYFNTFGGSPVAAAAGLAVLDVIREENLIENAKKTGAFLIENLKNLSNKHLAIGDVRGAGLLVAMELVSNRKSKKPDTAQTVSVINQLKENGILIGAAGAWGNILKIRPPLCFTKDNVEFFVSTCDQIFSTSEIVKSKVDRYARTKK